MMSSHLSACHAVLMRRYFIDSIAGKGYRFASYKKLEVLEGQKSTDLNPKVGMLSIGPIGKVLLVNISLEKKAETKSDAY